MRAPLILLAALLLACTAAAEAQPAAAPERPLGVLLDSAALVERLRALPAPPANLRVKPLIDAECVRVAPLMRFRPARVDGVPAVTWVTLPLTYTFEEPSLDNDPPPNPGGSRQPRFP